MCETEPYMVPRKQLKLKIDWSNKNTRTAKLHNNARPFLFLYDTAILFIMMNERNAATTFVFTCIIDQAVDLSIKYIYKLVVSNKKKYRIIVFQCTRIKSKSNIP